MKRLPGIFLAILLLALFTAAETGPPSVSHTEAEAEDASAEWKEEAKGAVLAIYSRVRPGSSIREFKGVGIIEAPPSAVFAVLDDSEAYPSFMPYTSECRVLRRDKNSVLAYQRLELPLVSDRDYTLRTRHERWLGDDGLIFRIRWEPANDLGPAPTPGVQRVGICEGGWLLQPHSLTSTRATYSIYTDSGGTIPALIAHSGSRIAIRKIFEAIRKQVREPKYLATKR